MHGKEYLETSKPVFLQKTLVSHPIKTEKNEKPVPDLSGAQTNKRHTLPKQNYVDITLQRNVCENETKPSKVKPLPPMNLYAVKKQQKRIAALLAADREASESHATSKQRRDLIKKRMNNIVQVSQYSKLSKEYKKKYDASVNYYLKDFYEKNEMTLQHPSTFDDLTAEDDRMHSEEGATEMLTPDSDHVPMIGLPSMTISVNSHKIKNSRKSEQKTILEQMERMHQLRKTSRPDSVRSEDRIFSLVYRSDVKAQPPPKCLYIPNSQETNFYRALPTTEHIMPLADDPVQPNGTVLIALEPVVSNQLQTQPNDDFPSEVKLTVTDAAQLQPQYQSDDIKPNDKVVNRDVSPEFRRIQVELRERKKIQASNAHSLLSNNDREPIRILPRLGNLELNDSCSIHSGRRGSQYTVAARSSFLSDTDSLYSNTSTPMLSLSAAMLSGSFSGPLPVIPSLDLSGSDISSKRLTEVTQGISRSSTAYDLNTNIRPFSETRKKNHSASIFAYVDTRHRGKVRRAGKLHTPTPRHSVSMSKASSSFEPALSQDGLCDCEEALVKPRVYKSCNLCYNTFRHQSWCEKGGTVRSLHCETCGGKVRGVLSPSPVQNIDNEIITDRSSLSDKEYDNDQEDNKSACSDGNGKDINVADEDETQVQTSGNIDEVLTNLPVIRLEDSDEWIDRQLERRTPSETSSRRMIASPDTMMNHIESMLGSVAYDNTYNSNVSANDAAISESSIRLGEDAENGENTTGSSPTEDKGATKAIPVSKIQSQDWTKVHQQAYVAAIADVRSKQLPLRPEYFSLRTTRSYTSTYFNKLPWGDDVANLRNKTYEFKSRDTTPEMKKIFGKITPYDYYPGGKRHHLRNIQPIPKIKARQ